VEEGYTHSFVARTTKEILEGAVKPVHGASASSSSSAPLNPGRCICAAWFDELLTVAHQNPDPDGKVVTYEIKRMRYQDLYSEFYVDCVLRHKLVSTDIPTKRVWRNVWAIQFPHLRFREKKTVDTKDRVCTVHDL
jgi:hypothetical protein